MQIVNKRLKISLVDGLLSITGQDHKEILIPEASMRQYEQFYRCYLAAISSTQLQEGDTQDGDFLLEPWVWNSKFRSLLIEACKHLGIEDLEQFTPAQIKALLVNYEGSIGLLFQLHETFPKLRNLEKTKPKSEPRKSVSSKVRNFFASLSNKVTSLAFGLIPALCL